MHETTAGRKRNDINFIGGNRSPKGHNGPKPALQADNTWKITIGTTKGPEKARDDAVYTVHRRPTDPRGQNRRGAANHRGGKGAGSKNRRRH